MTMKLREDIDKVLSTMGKQWSFVQKRCLSISSDGSYDGSTGEVTGRPWRDGDSTVDRGCLRSTTEPQN